MFFLFRKSKYMIILNCFDIKSWCNMLSTCVPNFTEKALTSSELQPKQVGRNRPNLGQKTHFHFYLRKYQKYWIETNFFELSIPEIPLCVNFNEITLKAANLKFGPPFLTVSNPYLKTSMATIQYQRSCVTPNRTGILLPEFR